MLLDPLVCFESQHPQAVLRIYPGIHQILADHLLALGKAFAQHIECEVVGGTGTLLRKDLSKLWTEEALCIHMIKDAEEFSFSHTIEIGIPHMRLGLRPLRICGMLVSSTDSQPIIPAPVTCVLPL